MNLFDAAVIADGARDADDATRLNAWALLIRSGLAWKLSGFARPARRLIFDGFISPDGEVIA